MKVNVKYFGLLAEKIGTASEDIDFPQGIDSESLLNSIKEKYPELAELPFKLAVDQEIVIGKTEVPEGAEVALLPAYAGG